MVSNISSTIEFQGKPSDCNYNTTKRLCFLFGMFGIHRFYTGKILTGLLMLFTLGGILIWASIDYLMLTMGHYRDSKGLIVRPKTELDH